MEKSTPPNPLKLLNPILPAPDAATLREPPQPIPDTPLTPDPASMNMWPGTATFTSVEMGRLRGLELKMWLTNRKLPIELADAVL